MIHMKNNEIEREEIRKFPTSLQKQGMISRYIKGYRQSPETKYEIEVTREAATIILSGVPW